MKNMCFVSLFTFIQLTYYLMYEYDFCNELLQWINILTYSTWATSMLYPCQPAKLMGAATYIVYDKLNSMGPVQEIA